MNKFSAADVINYWGGLEKIAISTQMIQRALANRMKRIGLSRFSGPGSLESMLEGGVQRHLVTPQDLMTSNTIRHNPRSVGRAFSNMPHGQRGKILEEAQNLSSWANRLPEVQANRMMNPVRGFSPRHIRDMVVGVPQVEQVAAPGMRRIHQM